MPGPATPYDQVLYPGHPFVQTHPDRLATAARLAGLEAAPADGCRYLELGCGIGANTIPMACQLPGSRFLGVDLSGESIARGQRTLEALGLTNIALLHADIMGFETEEHAFDYIVGHGLYGWVPDPVRARIFETLARSLARNGVGYLSYNCYPGAHLREIARDAMLFHVRDMDDPKQRVAQARAIMKFLAAVTPARHVYGIAIRDQAERVSEVPDEVLFHDDLEPASKPFLFRDIAAAAQANGLQYLGEASLSHGFVEGYPEAAVRLVESIPDEEIVLREQYLDFIECRTFRKTLFCRAGVRLDRRRLPERIRTLHLAADLTPPGGIDPAQRGPAEFKTADGHALTADRPLAKAALLELGESWPETIAFQALLERAGARVDRAPSGEERVEAEALLMRGVLLGRIEAHAHPPPLTTQVAERPIASRYARQQVTTDTLVTNLRHCTVRLEDEIVRRFLALIDGTRTVEDLVRDLSISLRVQPPKALGDAQPPEITAGAVKHHLRHLAKLGLLEPA
jgi:SAM-dependent methyltransferase/methyltransferase-like protein